MPRTSESLDTDLAVLISTDGTAVNDAVVAEAEGVHGA